MLESFVVILWAVLTLPWWQIVVVVILTLALIALLGVLLIVPVAYAVKYGRMVVLSLALGVLGLVDFVSSAVVKVAQSGLSRASRVLEGV